MKLNIKVGKQTFKEVCSNVQDKIINIGNGGFQ